ncbi:GAF domain-containing protein [Candidatus Synechococcus calcipolaris G9]|uniref:GAF domain-containing protein n=1 Tax=Candidatus Synechococcus calcipolaris G9 TaxID=1497997 RepID=A0ABT6EVF7_9SYNE|nr:HD family phosphohydrolase [Candidatus Synechococcus calcipolaris]MDG2989791.1 GAF domain-containing protein [Candidatus Synechococcus calcipolaris G9]
MTLTPHTIGDELSLTQFQDNQEQLVEELVEIGVALSATQDLGTLLNLILSKSREITWSDAGSVFLIDREADPPCLWFKTAQNDSCATPTLLEFSIPLSYESLVGYVALSGETLNISDAYTLTGEETYQFNRSLDDNLGYRTRSVLVVPMQNIQGQVIGVLQLINRKTNPRIKITPENATVVTQAYSPSEERILRSLASQAAVILERNHLLDSIENLFEGFVTASIQAIEARDPTTSGHSERVAALTVYLAERLNGVSSGPLHNVVFSDRQLQEIRYAALLHDFGKVAVPETILNKEKKIFPEQLEIIRQRFALVRRTLEMDCTQAKLDYALKHPHRHDSGEEDPCDHCAYFRELDQTLARQLHLLDDYWQILEQANEPKVLEEEPLARLKDMTQFFYRGIDGQAYPLLTVPELEQLMIRRGSLTQKERQMIESHVTYTYKFLSRIPWTDHLKDVPIIAYGHHERLNGGGYPRGIGQAEIPIQTQMLAIADIYDALTASDRPYKKSLPVSRALSILRQEAADFKVNSDLVQLFEQQQIFRILGHILDQ